MKTLINKILEEWAYRVHNGMPNIKNPLHIVHLKESMEYLHIPNRVIDGFIQNLMEEKIYKARAKDSGKIVLFKDKDEWKNAIKSGSHEPVASDEKENGKKDEKPGEKSDKEPEEKSDKEPEEKSDKEPEDTGPSANPYDKGLKTKKYPESSRIYKEVEPGHLIKSHAKLFNSSADYDVKQLGLKYGYKTIKDNKGNIIFKPAPGNPGSMMNEIISGEVAQILEENPNLSEKELTDLILNHFGGTELLKQNEGSKPAGGIKKLEIPDGQNPGLYSKVLLTVKSGKRKHKKAQEAAKKNGFKNPKSKNYYGHKQSMKAMINDISGYDIIGPDGTPVSPEEAKELILSGGGGDNPSDTATLVFDSDSKKVVMLFHSDKDSTDAIVAQSSAKAEAEANQENIDNLVNKGMVTEEQAESLEGMNIEMYEQQKEIENELKKVAGGPGKFFIEKVNISEALKNAKNNTSPDGSIDKNKTSSHLSKSLMSRGKTHPSLVKYLDTDSPSEEESLTAFFKYMADEDKEIEPTASQMKLMDRLNRRYQSKGAPDVDPKIEEIRKRTIEIEVSFIKKMDGIILDVGDGKQVGVGTFLEANTIHKQFHLEAMNPNSKKGVHKFSGMFETNHAGLSVDGEVLRKCMPGVESKDDFISNLEVGETQEQKGVSGTQKGRTTGSKRIVYAITSGGTKIPIGVKVARSKEGKLGKLQTVYQWSDDMKKCFGKHGKR